MAASPTPPRRTVAHVNLARGFRGGERQTELLVRELARRGVAQRLVARAAEPLIVRLADVPSLQRHAVRGIVGAARALRGATLAHAHEGRCVQAAALARWFAGVPYVITRRVVRPLGDNVVTRRIYRDAAALVGLSSPITEALAEFAPGASVHRIPSAFTPLSPDASRVGELRRRFGGGPIVGHVGALVDRHKGQRVLLDVARSRPDVTFVFVGGGEDEAALRAEADGLPNVRFTGHVDDVPSHLASFDLFAFPSRHEGLGSVLLDAMALELPIVASRTGGIPDIIDDGDNGLLVPPGDAPALGAAIDRLLGDRDLQARFAASNRSAIDDFSVGRMADRYEALYREVLQ